MHVKNRLLPFLALCPILFGFGPPTGFDIHEGPTTDDSVRLILIGDTGQVPVADDPHKMNPEQREQLRRSLAAEQATAIIDLGDLFYWKGPRCRLGTTPQQSGERLDAHLYDHIGGLGAPVFLVLGNHDVGPMPEALKKHFFGNQAGKRSRSRERCYRLQQKLHDDIVFPAVSYGVDFGPVRLATLHTSAPRNQWAANHITDFFADQDDDWSLLAGHHVLQTGCDKTSEDVVSPWLQKSGLKPDLYMNGHAHILQVGVFDGVPAITSGSGSKLREFPHCEPTDTQGVQWGASEFGYAVLEANADWLRVQFKNIAGEKLHCWERDRVNPTGRECED